MPDGGKFLVVADYSTPRGFPLWRRVEELTQKHLKSVLVAIIVGALLWSNTITLNTLFEAQHLGEYCAVWASTN
jgi:hypothetical protein